MSIITTKEKIDTIAAIFGEVQQSSDCKNISTYCPVCAKSSKTKKKRKLSISLETGVFHCWVCESKGRNVYSFAKKNCIKSSDIDRLKAIFGNIDTNKNKEEETYARLPDDFKLLSLTNSRISKMIKRYLRNRGLTDDDLLKYKAGFSEKREFKDSVIFPSFDDKLCLNYYLARVIRKDAYIKYKNCGVSKKDIIFNENTINWKNEVILVEGIFDAIKIGDNAIPILGSWIDEDYYLFQKIIQENASVIICLDLDARKKQIKLLRKFYEYGIEVKTVDLESDKDIGDFSKKEVFDIISQAKRFDNTQRMRYLISGIKSGSVF